MNHEVFMTATAKRDLQRISPRIVPAIIEFAFGDLAFASRRGGKPLQLELEGLFSARRGPYRLLYSINDNTNRVEILRIDYRSDVYRND